MWIVEEEKFVIVHDERTQLEKPICQARRLSIQTRGKIALSCQGKAHLHSILSFDRSPGLILPLRGIWSEF